MVEQLSVAPLHFHLQEERRTAQVLWDGLSRACCSALGPSPDVVFSVESKTHILVLLAVSLANADTAP